MLTKQNREQIMDANFGFGCYENQEAIWVARQEQAEKDFDAGLEPVFSPDSFGDALYSQLAGAQDVAEMEMPWLLAKAITEYPKLTTGELMAIAWLSSSLTQILAARSELDRRMQAERDKLKNEVKHRLSGFDETVLSLKNMSVRRAA